MSADTLEAFTQEAADEVARRQHMALSEVGHAGCTVTGWVDEGGRIVLRTSGGGCIPLRVRWKAREVVGQNEPRCFACVERDPMAPAGICVAAARFTQDCGVAR